MLSQENVSRKKKRNSFLILFFLCFSNLHLNEDKNFGEEIATFANIESANTFLKFKFRADLRDTFRRDCVIIMLLFCEELGN